MEFEVHVVVVRRQTDGVHLFCLCCLDCLHVIRLSLWFVVWKRFLGVVDACL